MAETGPWLINEEVRNWWLPTSWCFALKAVGVNRLHVVAGSVRRHISHREQWLEKCNLDERLLNPPPTPLVNERFLTIEQKHREEQPHPTRG